jgi:hypothetical protein
MTPTDIPPDTASADEIRNFILEDAEQSDAAPEPAIPETEDLDLDESTVANVRQGGDAEREQVDDQRADPDFPDTVGGAMDQMGAGGVPPELQLAAVFEKILSLPSSSLIPTEVEKDLFMCALESHEPVVFTVQLAPFRGKSQPRLRCLTARERRLVFQVTDRETSENSARVLTPSPTWYDCLARLSLAYQLVEWPGLSLPGLDADKTKPDDKVVCAELLEYANTHLRDLSDPTYRLMLSALRIFECKMQMLQSLATQPSFSTPDDGASASEPSLGD